MVMSYPDRSTAGPRTANGGHLPLGRYAGIPARAHWSLLVILGLVTQLLALRVLPAALPGRHPVGYWLVGTGAAVTFLAAILAHELAHAIAARRHGVEVKHITLWMLGGVTELGGEAGSPRAEAVIAGSGPAISLALGGAFAGLTWLFAGPGLLAVALAWLAGVNLLLGLFNLLPGAPLDGGRILRAALWRRHRDRARAAEASARAGTVVGMVIVGLGVVQLVTGTVLGLWLMLIGWFMVGAANAERQAAAGTRLAGRVARDVMATPPVLAPAWWTVAAFADRLRHEPAPAPVLPMVDFDGSPAGLVTLRDLQRVPAEDRDTTRLREATRLRIGPLVVAPDTPLPELVGPIRAHAGVAVVVDEGRVVGTIGHADLAAAAAVASLSAQPDAAAPSEPSEPSDSPVTAGRARVSTVSRNTSGRA
jgi:Zn-dependent protease